MAELKDRYAAALLELSLEKNALDAHLEQAAFMIKALQQDRCDDFLRHPHIPDGAKHQLLHSLFEGRISEDLMGFLYLTIKRSRELLILPALSAFVEKGNRHAGRVTANVVSAMDMTPEQIKRLGDVLSKKLDKQVKIQARVDPALIGGLYVNVDGRMIDSTVRTKLFNMRNRLIKGGAE